MKYIKRMIRTADTVALALALAAASRGLAQTKTPPTILFVDVENFVEYQMDTPDLSKIATNPNVTPASPPKNFFHVVCLGDIVAVDGEPARGTLSSEGTAIYIAPSANPGGPLPGEAIADTVRNALWRETFEILKTDGTPVGTILGSGVVPGTAPPGAPLAQTVSNLAIVGGTGAFLGARGQYGGTPMPGGIAGRIASMSEDPAYRRQNGGGKRRYILHLIPMLGPQIGTASGGPAITHSSDFTQVTAAKPAAAGEVLSLFASGLGPTNPPINPGQPFPANSLALVNSPVEVAVNGKPAEVLSAAGFPGAVDGYQVNFRVPPDAAKGAATVQLRAAWVVGTPVTIDIQ